MINQSLLETENLCLETETGSFNEIEAAELKQLIKPESGKLNFDVVLLNMPNAHGVAQVFRELGISHVIYFKLDTKEMQSDTLRELMNYVSIEMIKSLVDEKTIY